MFSPCFFPYQCGVDGLYLVLLKRSEAGYLAAQVGVNQHLRCWEKQMSISYIQMGNNLSVSAHHSGGHSSYRTGDN